MTVTVVAVVVVVGLLVVVLVGVLDGGRVVEVVDGVGVVVVTTFKVEVDEPVVGVSPAAVGGVTI